MSERERLVSPAEAHSLILGLIYEMGEFVDAASGLTTNQIYRMVSKLTSAPRRLSLTQALRFAAAAPFPKPALAAAHERLRKIGVTPQSPLSFGAAMRRLRKAKGSQAVVGRIAGVSPMGLQAIETGRDSDVDLLLSMLAAVGIEPVTGLGIALLRHPTTAVVIRERLTTGAGLSAEFHTLDYYRAVSRPKSLPRVIQPTDLSPARLRAALVELTIASDPNRLAQLREAAPWFATIMDGGQPPLVPVVDVVEFAMALPISIEYLRAADVRLRDASDGKSLTGGERLAALWPKNALKSHVRGELVHDRYPHAIRLLSLMEATTETPTTGAENIATWCLSHPRTEAAARKLLANADPVQLPSASTLRAERAELRDTLLRWGKPPGSPRLPAANPRYFILTSLRDGHLINLSAALLLLDESPIPRAVLAAGERFHADLGLPAHAELDEVLRLLAERHGGTTGELAAAARVEPELLKGLLAGERREYQLGQMAQLLKALGVNDPQLVLAIIYQRHHDTRERALHRLREDERVKGKWSIPLRTAETWESYREEDRTVALALRGAFVLSGQPADDPMLVQFMQTLSSAISLLTTDVLVNVVDRMDFPRRNLQEAYQIYQQGEFGSSVFLGLRERESRRSGRDIGQRDLAKSAGIDRAHLTKAERGNMEWGILQGDTEALIPMPWAAVKLCRHCDITDPLTIAALLYIAHPATEDAAWERLETGAKLTDIPLPPMDFVRVGEQPELARALLNGDGELGATPISNQPEEEAYAQLGWAWRLTQLRKLPPEAPIRHLIAQQIQETQAATVARLNGHEENNSPGWAAVGWPVVAAAAQWARHRSGLSAAELAEKLEISESDIHAYEEAVVREPAFMRRVFDACGYDEVPAMPDGLGVTERRPAIARKESPPTYGRRISPG